MTLTEARKILALSPDEDPHACLADFKIARERIVELVSTESNAVLADRYYEGLAEFDQALAVIRDFLDAPGLAPPLLPPATAILSGVAAPDEDGATGPRRRVPVWFVWLLVVILTIVAAGGLLYYQYNGKNKVLQRQARIAWLEREGSGLVENRRW